MHKEKNEVTKNEDISALEWTGDGSCVSVGTWSEGRIEVIDAQANIPVRALVGHNGLVRSLHIPSSSSSSSSSSPLSPSSSSSFSHSENTLVSASHDKRVILWDLRSNGSIFILFYSILFYLISSFYYSFISYHLTRERKNIRGALRQSGGSPNPSIIFQSLYY